MRPRSSRRSRRWAPSARRRSARRPSTAARRRATPTPAPSDDLILPAGSLEAEDYEALARATVLGEPDAMMAAAQRFTRSHPDSGLSPGARLVVAAARDLAGRRPEAREALETLSDEDSRAGKVAQGILEGPGFGPLHRRE